MYCMHALNCLPSTKSDRPSSPPEKEKEEEEEEEESDDDGAVLVAGKGGKAGAVFAERAKSKVRNVCPELLFALN